MSLPEVDHSKEVPDNPAPKILMPGEGASVRIGKGARCTFKLVGEETHSLFGLFEYEMAPGTAGPKPHTHKQMEEIFYVAEGEVELLVADQRTSAGKGTLALVPRGTVHAFANPGKVQSVLLIMFCPADAREKYFQGLAELTEGGRMPDKEALLALMRANDQEPVNMDDWTF